MRPFNLIVPGDVVMGFLRVFDCVYVCVCVGVWVCVDNLKMSKVKRSATIITSTQSERLSTFLFFVLFRFFFFFYTVLHNNKGKSLLSRLSRVPVPRATCNLPVRHNLKPTLTFKQVEEERGLYCFRSD